MAAQAVSVVTAGRDTQMRSLADEHFQPKSALQCEEHSHCLSSPPGSDTSAQSHEDPSIFYRVAAANMYSLLLPADTFGLSGLSSVELPTDGMWKPDSILSFGKLHHHLYLIHCRCINAYCFGH